MLKLNKYFNFCVFFKQSKLKPFLKYLYIVIDKSCTRYIPNVRIIMIKYNANSNKTCFSYPWTNQFWLLEPA